jgi:hypothetical protein
MKSRAASEVYCSVGKVSLCQRKSNKGCVF